MKKYVYIIILMVSLSISAQDITKLTVKENEQFLIPKVSFDGKYLALSSMDYNKLIVYDVISDAIIAEVSGTGIGWGFQWSGSEHLIGLRENIWNKDDRTTKIKIINQMGELFTETQQFQDASLPYWSADGKILNFKPSRLEAKAITVSNTFKDDGLFIDGHQLIVNYTSLKLPEPFVTAMASGRVLSFSYSPDGKRVAVEYVSSGIRVYDLQYGIIFDLGEGEAPTWTNKDYLVYMVVEDDGHQILGGELIQRKYDGADRINLTQNFDIPAFYPSAQGKTIYFSDLEGSIYRLILN